MVVRVAAAGRCEGGVDCAGGAGGEQGLPDTVCLGVPADALECLHVELHALRRGGDAGCLETGNNVLGVVCGEEQLVELRLCVRARYVPVRFLLLLCEESVVDCGAPLFLWQVRAGCRSLARGSSSLVFIVSWGGSGV